MSGFNSLMRNVALQQMARQQPAQAPMPRQAPIAAYQGADMSMAPMMAYQQFRQTGQMPMSIPQTQVSGQPAQYTPGSIGPISVGQIPGGGK